MRMNPEVLKLIYLFMNPTLHARGCSFLKLLIQKSQQSVVSFLLGHLHFLLQEVGDAMQDGVMSEFSH